MGVLIGPRDELGWSSVIRVLSGAPLSHVMDSVIKSRRLLSVVKRGVFRRGKRRLTWWRGLFYWDPGSRAGQSTLGVNRGKGRVMDGSNK